MYFYRNCDRFSDWQAVIIYPSRSIEQSKLHPHRSLLTRTELSPLDSRAIIEIITTIMTYRFDELSRVEIEAMLDITLKETRVYREIKEEGREEGLEQGRQEEAVNFVTRLLRKRLGELPQEVRSVVLGLSLSMLEELGEALLDFTSVADLQTWLEARIDN